jgi:serine/threonine protein kinase
VGDYKFDVRKEIGSGYSSKVYKAISLKDNLDYAIKAVEFNNFKPSHFEMLENEIKILKKMSHTNVIKFYSVSKTATHLYIITEFCQKGDLLTYMTRKGILP